MYRVAIVLLLIVLAGLQYRLWIGDGSLAEGERISNQLQTLKKINAKATNRNEAMQTEIVDLKRGHGSVEGRARAEMGMIKPGETFFLTLPDGTPAKKTPDAPKDKP